MDIFCYDAPMLSPHLFHPAAVHFPIAFLFLGFAAGAAAHLRRGPPWLGNAASLLLWLGAAAVWAALGLGLLAQESAPHVPAAWETLEDHESLAWASAAAFTVLSVWRWRRPGAAPRLFLILWLAACGLLTATAFEGGELVFKHGMGVIREEG